MENSHRVVVGLDGKLLLGVFLDFGYDRIIGWPHNIVERDGSRLVEIRLSFEDGIDIDRHGSPAMEGDGIGVGAHGGDVLFLVDDLGREVEMS